VFICVYLRNLRETKNLDNTMGKHTRKTSVRQAAKWPDQLFLLLAGFITTVLPFIHSKEVMDISLMPRLLSLIFFLIVIVLIFYINNIYRQLDLSVLRKSVFPIYGGFLLVSAISLFFATNVTAGFFDLFKLFSFLVLLAFASLILLKTAHWPTRLSQFFVVGTLMILAMGYYQYLTELGPGFHDRFVVAALKGLMSNINLYASYLMMMVPFLIYGVIYLKKAWRTMAIIALLANLFMIFLLQTRAVYMGLMVGFVLTLVVSLIAWKQLSITKKIRNMLGIAFIGGAIALSGLFMALPKDNIYVSRISSMFSDTENPRLMIWEITGKMIADHTVTGVGAGNFAVRLQGYYGGYDFSTIDTNWLRPHNDYLWVLSEKGLLGGILFLLFFGMAIYYAIFIIRSEAEQKHKWLAVMLFFGITSYMINAFFDFPLERINHQAVLALYLASLVSMVHLQTPGNKPLTVPRNYLLIPVLLLLMVGVRYTTESIRVEKQVAIARAANASEQWRVMLEAGQKAQSSWRTLDALAVPVSFFEAFAHFRLGNNEQSLQAFFDAYAKNPYRKYILNNIGVIYLQSGRYEEAEVYFKKTLHMYPNDIETITYVAESFVVREMYPEALQTLEQIPAESRSDRLNILYNHLIEQTSLQ
jgi:O-antigen ligase